MNIANPAFTLRSSARDQTRQSGIVLIVGLIMLLVLTLLGLAASSGTTLEEKMVHNDQNRQLAFQGAEAALNDAQTRLSTGSICASFNNSGGCNLPPQANKQPLWQNIDWSNPDNSFAYSGSLSGLSNKPRFFIEQLQSEPAPGTDLADTNQYGGNPVQAFQITSEGTTSDTPGEVLLQSVYRP